jgi:hypothetical protein
MHLSKVLSLAAFLVCLTGPIASADTDSPVGTYVVETITETVNGFSCTSIQQSGVEIDCESTRIGKFNADGTIIGRNRSAPASFLTDQDGFWRQRANGKVVIESVFQLFDENGDEAGFIVGKARVDFSNDYDSYEGTFESFSFVDGQDILDEFATPSATLEGTIRARRLFKR